MKHLILVLGGLLSAMNSYAATYTVTQITDDNYNNEYARMNDKGDVLWAAQVNSTDPGWTLYEYMAKPKKTMQISDNNASFNTHQLNNNGDAVWTASDGHDQEVYLYDAKTMSVTALTNNDNNDTNPQISDNGDVTWLEQQGTTTANAIVMRYDHTTMTSSAVEFAGATRQGQQTMNARGDIVWNAVLADNQQVLLYDAASGSMKNISNNENAINSNQRLTDNGDVVWEAYDMTSYQQDVMYYKASDGSTTQVVANVGAHLFGSHGNVVWVSYLNGSYTITTYDPATGTTKDIATETSSRAPGVTGISARGDVTWRVISGTSWISRVYNAQTDTIVDLTNTQGSGTYDLDVADNGDVVWSLWDGTDYEVFSYQGDSGVITQLTDNQVNDGVTLMNSSGTILWNRFDPTDNELMQAVRNPKPLTIKVNDMEMEQQEGEAGMKARFHYEGLPNQNDNIAVTLDGISLVDEAFSKFTANDKGLYRYKDADTEVTINFNSNVIEAEKHGIDVSAMQTNDVVVSVSFGPSTAESSFMQH